MSPSPFAHKTNPGNFFEDFRIGQSLRHATPRTITTGDVALTVAFTGNRFAVQSADSFASSIGYPKSPVDDLLAFHVAFGKTVPDVSLNAVANLGYAECRFLLPVYPGDTLATSSEVIGLRENANKETGVVYVRSTAVNQHNEPVLTWARWVMVRKRDKSAAVSSPIIPKLAERVEPADLGKALPSKLNLSRYDTALSGAAHKWGDYAVGEKIDHVDGTTIEEAEHALATRLYQNTAKVHFNRHTESQGRFGKRLMYGGHVISIARALSFNGLANAFHISAINGGRHVAPCFAGDTVYAWSEILEKAELPHHAGVGALRIRTIATKDRPCADFPLKTPDGKDAPGVILDLDYWAIMPR